MDEKLIFVWMLPLSLRIKIHSVIISCTTTATKTNNTTLDLESIIWRSLRSIVSVDEAIIRNKYFSTTAVSLA